MRCRGALWQRWEFAARIDGHELLHAILFGNLGLLMGALCLAGLGWAWTRPRRALWIPLLALGVAGGLVPSMLSGTRGGWLALPLMLLVFQRGFVRWLTGRTQLAICLTVLTLGVSAYAVPQTGVEQRAQLAVTELRHYLAEEPASTRSLILRLEM